ncbi:MAG: hypothetical protein HFJ94_05105 [Muribaculaceae bacterium]|nr:hypothetical protein [Muribaculaceae bacterium]
MEPFLKQVAKVYVDNEAENLSQYCFVFPNKRSANFFKHYLEGFGKEYAGTSVKTITSFVSGLSHTNVASRLEQLFILYNEYRKLTGEAVEFDQFMFWGDMILADFSDVDRYLVDPDSLFTNVKRFKEIGSNYLTQEQIDIIRRYWGEDPGTREVERFWKHIGDETTTPGTKFTKLWEVLSPLYHAFNGELAKEGKASGGMMYRKALEALRKYVVKGTLLSKRFIFVGFNVLTLVETEIFTLLRDHGAADFYWDYNSPAFANGFNRAGRFIERNIKDFPSIYELPEESITTLPDIEIIGVPSGIAQTKVAGALLRGMVENKAIVNPDNAIDTALVLPDESLFVPMKRSIPDNLFKKVNVTMGLPMKLTSIASLMRLIVNLQLRVRHSAGGSTFFYKDVNALLSDPSIRNLDPGSADAITDAIYKNNLFRVSPELFNDANEQLRSVFTILKADGSNEDVFDYITSVIEALPYSISDKNSHESDYLQSYSKAVDEVRQLTGRFSIRLTPSVFFRLVERTISSKTINYKGEPLSGLQIMGVLETRALDFNNIIMLSMNERIFPRKHFSGSFIPDTIRRGFGIATTDFQESIFAYYFYRLISRAKNVKLLYDARTIGMKTGEKSRYLTQLIYLFGKSGKIKQSLRVFEPRTFDTEAISVVKNSRIIKLLSRYKPEAESPKYLSASAINNYVACPLKFYLEYVEGFNGNEEMKDYIDSGVYGTIVHDSCEALYKELIKSHGSNTITKEMLDSLLAPAVTRLERTITAVTNREYNRLPDDRLNTPLTGEALIMGNVIKESVKKILEVDKGYTPFVFDGAEESMIVTLDINDSLKVNFKQKIDRIDIVDGTKRIVDYKTGDENTRLSDLSVCFDHTAKDHRKAVAQTLLYCYVYNLHKKKDIGLKPCIYNLRKITTKGPLDIVVGKETINDHRKVMDTFVPLLNHCIEEIFDPETPFFQTEDVDRCKFCGFTGVCGRIIDKDKF